MNITRGATGAAQIMGRLTCGSDLLDELTHICTDKNIRLGRIEAIGAVQKAHIGYYDQDSREYRFNDIDKHLEILKLAGNISIKDGSPMVHAHITLADSDGRAFGGHLAQGTVVFACEYIIEPFEGKDLVRSHDPETDLPLWSDES